MTEFNRVATIDLNRSASRWRKGQVKRIPASVNVAVEAGGVPTGGCGGEGTMPSPYRRHYRAKLLDALRYYAALSVFGLASLLFSLAAVPIRFLLPRASGVRIGRAAISFCFRMFVRALVRGGLVRIDLSAISELKGEHGLLIVANHPSILDAVFLVSALPKAACIMKSTLAESRVLGGGARLAGYLRNVSPRRLVGDAVTCLREGGQLLVFPEGTRTRVPPIGQFAAGFAVMAREAGAPIQVILIDAPRDPAWSRSIFSAPELPLVYRVSLGGRYDPEDDARELAERIEADLRLALTSSAADDHALDQPQGTAVRRCQ